MTNPTEERLWDWIDGVLTMRPYRLDSFIEKLCILAVYADPEDFTNMLPLLRLYYYKYPVYSCKEWPLATQTQG